MQLTEKNGLVINIDGKTQYYSEKQLQNIIKASKYPDNSIFTEDVPLLRDPSKYLILFENPEKEKSKVYCKGIPAKKCNEVQNPVTTLTKEEYTMEVKEEVKENDMVNNPNHYGGKNNIYEAIKVIEAWNCNFNIGNAVKYLSRAGKKDNIVQDLSKAIWYINREIENLNKK